MVTITLTGHLSLPTLTAQLLKADQAIGSTSAAFLLIDCTAMSGYDSDARSAFIQWNRENREQIKGLAIVISNPLWHMVIKTMSFAARQDMAPFTKRSEAEQWLAKQEKLVA